MYQQRGVPTSYTPLTLIHKMKIILRVSFILAILCVLVFPDGYARYNSFRSKDGILYFFNPQKLKETKNIKSFEYDMTMLTWTDSVTINFTIVSESMSMPTDLSILSGESKYECHDYSLLYVDLQKRDYKVRITSKFPLQEVEKIVESTIPPIFEFKQNDILRTATYKRKAWETDREKIKQIMGLYYHTK